MSNEVGAGGRFDIFLDSAFGWTLNQSKHPVLSCILSISGLPTPYKFKNKIGTIQPQPIPACYNVQAVPILPSSPHPRILIQPIQPTSYQFNNIFGKNKELPV